VWGFGVSDDSLDGLSPVVGGGLVHDKQMFCEREHPFFGVGSWSAKHTVGS